MKCVDVIIKKGGYLGASGGQNRNSRWLPRRCVEAPFPFKVLYLSVGTTKMYPAVNLYVPVPPLDDYSPPSHPNVHEATVTILGNNHSSYALNYKSSF